MNIPAPSPQTSGEKQEREEMFRLLVEQVKDYAIFRLDNHGIVASWNAGAEHIKGYQAQEIIGHHFSRFYTDDSIRAGWPQTEIELARRDGRFEDEGWRVRKDGSRFWANVVITALYDDTGAARGFAKITRDLTDRRRVERLETDARQMGEFVAMLAHELRNPLGPIKNALAIAEQSTADATRMQWALGIIKRQSGHLNRLVDDLLDMSRITRGAVRIERRRVSLRDVIASAIETVRHHCEGKSQALSFQVDDDVTVRGDAVRLAQVFSNIIGNACKYTPAGGRIDIRLSTVKENAQISVRDSGVGIPPDLLPRIFDVFTQADRPLARSDGGLGLGLAIAHRLVALHRGTLIALSEGPGCGSEFVVTLPRFLRSDSTSEADVPGALTVLIVEDNVDAAETLGTLLSIHGHRVLLAHDGAAGLKLAKEELPDLVIADIGLPVLDGYGLARELRRLPELEGVTLAALTGYGTDDDIRRAHDAGFDAHVTKPADYDTLRRQIPMLAHDERGPAE